MINGYYICGIGLKKCRGGGGGRREKRERELDAFAYIISAELITSRLESSLPPSLSLSQEERFYDNRSKYRIAIIVEQRLGASTGFALDKAPRAPLLYSRFAGARSTRARAHQRVSRELSRELHLQLPGFAR